MIEIWTLKKKMKINNSFRNRFYFQIAKAWWSSTLPDLLETKSKSGDWWVFGMLFTHANFTLNQSCCFFLSFKIEVLEMLQTYFLKWDFTPPQNTKGSVVFLFCLEKSILCKCSCTEVFFFSFFRNKMIVCRITIIISTLSVISLSIVTPSLKCL